MITPSLDDVGDVQETSRCVCFVIAPPHKWSIRLSIAPRPSVGPLTIWALNYQATEQQKLVRNFQTCSPFQT